MKKLEDLKDDVLLCVGNRFDLLLIDAGEFKQNEELMMIFEHLDVSVAEIYHAEMSPETIVEYLEDDMFEGWKEEMLDDEDFIEAVKKLNEVLHKHPTYFEGEKVERKEM